jgi:photosystem II stability/assembly factor-like uncharacterized protein
MKNLIFHLLPAAVLLWSFSGARSQVFTETLRLHAPTYNRSNHMEVPLALRRYLQNETGSDTLAIPFRDDFSGRDLSWALSRFSFGRPIRHLHFSDPVVAVGLGDRGLRIRTTTRGNIWEDQAPGSDSPGVLAADFQDKLTGWACGRAAYLASTLDGGQTWALRNPPPVSPAGQSLVNLSFVNNQLGLVSDSSGSLFRTADGGNTWVRIDSAAGIKFRVQAVSWVGTSVALVAGMGRDTGQAAVSTDGGVTFIPRDIHFFPQRAFRKIRWFPFAGWGLALGDSGLVYKISGQGQIWRRVNPDLPFGLNQADVSPVNTNLVWIAGDRGTLLYSQNGGESFSRMRSGTAADLQSVALANEFRGWIGTGDGRLMQVVADPLRPVSRFWEPNSGVLINNGFPLNPITQGVATFDGLNPYGIPYSPVRRKTGPCDTLSSAYIDLKDFGSVPLFISFFYQQGNRQIQLVPDPEDSLVLQGRRPDGTWLSLWNVRGVSDEQLNSPFRYQSVAIPEALKTAGFKFRFINYGTQNGNFDIWNLDYVRVDGEHGPADSTDLDYAIGQPFGRLTRSWSALPLPQFRHLQEQNADIFPERISASVTNLVPGLAAVPGTFILRRERPDSLFVLATLDNTFIQGLENPLPPGISRNTVSVATPAFRQALQTRQPCTFEYGLALNSDPVVNRYLSNDTTFTRFTVSDYLAYDDGTAELARGVSDNNNIGAIRYYLPVADTLTDIQLYFVRTPENIQQQINFTLLVYDSLNPAVPGYDPQPLLRRQVILPPADSVNQFLTFSLRNAAPPDSRIMKGGRHFYIGWQQGAIDNGNEVRIGVDINNRNPGNFFYKFSTEWNKGIGPDDDFPFLFRPVFGPEVFTPVKDRIGKPTSPFFPNPAGNRIFNRQPYRNLIIRDVLGRERFSSPSGEGGGGIGLNLNSGLYLLFWEEESGQPVSQKLIIR